MEYYGYADEKTVELKRAEIYNEGKSEVQEDSKTKSTFDSQEETSEIDTADNSGNTLREEITLSPEVTNSEKHEESADNLLTVSSDEPDKKTDNVPSKADDNVTLLDNDDNTSETGTGVDVGKPNDTIKPNSTKIPSHFQFHPGLDLKKMVPRTKKTAPVEEKGAKQNDPEDKDPVK